MTVILGLGSNRKFNGLTPEELLEKAVSVLSGFLSGIRCSSVYRTGAMYYEKQDDFYNMVVSGDFEGTPRDLLDRIHAVEAELGRDRSKEFRNGPRSIDIDIELFGDLSVNESDLVIPHERLYERAFVLVPLVELLEKNPDVRIADLALLKEKKGLLGDQKIVLA